MQLGQEAYNLTCEPLPTIDEDVFTDQVKLGFVYEVVAVITACSPKEIVFLSASSVKAGVVEFEGVTGGSSCFLQDIVLMNSANKKRRISGCFITVLFFVSNVKLRKLLYLRK